MAKADLTAARLRELLDYNPETGVFTWRARPEHTRMKPGQIAGWVEKARGRITVEVDGRNHKAHRLAWLHTHGEWPAGVIDHKNGNPADNRLTNLRDTTQRINLQNQRRARSTSNSGVLGAHWCERDGGWHSSIGNDGKVFSVGRNFSTPEEAHAAYIAAKRRLHEGCTI